MNKISSAVIFSLLSFSCFLPIKSLTAQAQVQEFSFFRASPRLVKANTSFSSTNVWSRYNFYIDIPQEAENSLQKIVINQQSNLEIIEIYPEKTQVFILSETGEKAINNSATFTIDKSENISEVVINLSESIPAGTSIKVVLRVINPLYAGIYQFGVTVYPEGNNPRSLYLGRARFHFYRNGRF